MTCSIINIKAQDVIDSQRITNWNRQLVKARQLGSRALISKGFSRVEFTNFSVPSKVVGIKMQNNSGRTWCRHRVYSVVLCIRIVAKQLPCFQCRQTCNARRSIRVSATASSNRDINIFYCLLARQGQFPITSLHVKQNT